MESWLSLYRSKAGASEGIMSSLSDVRVWTSVAGHGAPCQQNMDRMGNVGSKVGMGRVEGVDHVGYIPATTSASYCGQVQCQPTSPGLRGSPTRSNPGQAAQQMRGTYLAGRRALDKGRSEFCGGHAAGIELSCRDIEMSRELKVEGREARAEKDPHVVPQPQLNN